MNSLFMFTLVNYFGLFLEFLKNMIIPTLLVGLLQYFVCKKKLTPILSYLILIISGIISLVLLFTFGSWIVMMAINSDADALLLTICAILCISPNAFPFIAALVVLLKSKAKNKKNSIDKMKLADL